MSSPRKFRVWIGDVMVFPNRTRRVMLLFCESGWELRAGWRTKQEKIVAAPRIDGTALMWHTGLTDTEGTEIYEGDIVDVPVNEMTEEIWRGVVRIGEHELRYRGEGPMAIIGVWLDIPSGSDVTVDKSLWERSEVVGNEHENPKLLEQEPA